jgi:hypothetical protein
MEYPFMIRRFLAALTLALVIILSSGISPVRAEKQYSQSQQTPAQAEQKSTQEPYSQSQQTPAQAEQKSTQKPYSQSEQTYGGGKQYRQSQQKPDSESED